MRVEVSKELLSLANSAAQRLIICYHGERIISPCRFLPAMDSLEWHSPTILLKINDPRFGTVCQGRIRKRLL